MENRYHVRSISLPCRLHSCTLRIDEELRKLKILETLSTTTHNKAGTIRVGLSSLGELYELVNDLLRLPLTQQSLVQHQQEKWVAEVVDGSVRLLDACDTTRDVLLQMKERVRELQSDLRRRRGKDYSSISAYISARKKAKKEIVKGLEALKQIEGKVLNGLMPSSPSLLVGLDDQNHQAVLARLLREICSVTISIFKLILSFMSAPAAPKPGWSVVSKLMMQRKVVAVMTYEEEEEEKCNEVESVDAAFRNFCKQSSTWKDGDVERVQKIQMAQRRLETLEVSIEDLEGGLDCMFRHLIQTRVSLLNILTP